MIVVHLAKGRGVNIDQVQSWRGETSKEGEEILHVEFPSGGTRSFKGDDAKRIFGAIQQVHERNWGKPEPSPIIRPLRIPDKPS
jgi:hypothetical protein